MSAPVSWTTHPTDVSGRADHAATLTAMNDEIVSPEERRMELTELLG